MNCASRTRVNRSRRSPEDSVNVGSRIDKSTFRVIAGDRLHHSPAEAAEKLGWKDLQRDRDRDEGASGRVLFAFFESLKEPVMETGSMRKLLDGHLALLAELANRLAEHLGRGRIRHAERKYVTDTKRARQH